MTETKFNLKRTQGRGFLLKMTSAIKSLDSGERDERIRSSTGDTENAFYRTLLAMVYIIKKLSGIEFDYVLPGKIQFDHVVREFSIYLCSSGSNFLITWEQVDSICSVWSSTIVKHSAVKRCRNTCYLKDLEWNDNDIELVENCFSESSYLNEEEQLILS